MLTRRVATRVIMVALLMGIATIGLGVKDLVMPIHVSEVTCEDRVLEPGDYCLDGGHQFSYEEMRAKEAHSPQKAREGIALVAFGSAAVIAIGTWGAYRVARNRRERQ